MSNYPHPAQDREGTQRFSVSCGTHGIKEWLLDMLFPVRCVGCHKIGSDYLCQTCLSKIPAQTKFTCIGCNKQAVRGETCWMCRDVWRVDHLFVATDYKNKTVARIIKLLKYSFIPECATSLGFIVERYIRYLAKHRNLSIFDSGLLIVPVPLFSARYNWRGFNQAELIARHVGDKFLLSIESQMIKRIRDKSPQAKIKRKEERMDNMKGVFEIIKGVQIPEAVLLIDDVCTTGATLDECARVFKEAGVKKVDALVIARGQ